MSPASSGTGGTPLRPRARKGYLEAERFGRILAKLLRVDPGDRVRRTAWRRSLRDYPRRRRGQIRGVIGLRDSPSRAPCRSHCSDQTEYEKTSTGHLLATYLVTHGYLPGNSARGEPNASA